MPLNKNKKVILLDSFDYLSKELKANDVEYSYVSLNSKSFDEAVLWLNSELFTPDYQHSDLQFIINVNLLFKGGNYEEQKGVDLYLAILHILHDRIENLSFVFYSPLSAINSAKLKPANSVLLHLPYIELSVEDICLVKETLERPCPLFNNSSENLLSGFYLTGAKPIDKNQNIFIIDDQYLEWEKALSLIFTKSNFYSFKRDSREEYKKLYNSIIHEVASNEVIAEFEEFVSKSDLIISDLYLTENHETGLWKTLDESRAISGFQLIKKIREINEFKPLVLFSTTNRARNIFVINSINLNGWSIKDNRSQISIEDKKDYFEEYSEMVISASTDFDVELSRIWNKFLYIKENYLNTWWYQKIAKIAKNEKFKHDTYNTVLQRIKESLNAFHKYYNQKRSISKASKKRYFFINPMDDFTIHSVIIETFKCIELIYRVSAKRNENTGQYDKVPLLDNFEDDISRYLFMVRNNSAHGSTFQSITANNAFGFLLYTIELLSLSELEINTYIKPDKLQPIGSVYGYNYQLLCNIQFYNHPSSSISKKAKELIQSAIENSFSLTNKKVLAIQIQKKGIGFNSDPEITENEAMRIVFDSFDCVDIRISETLLSNIKINEASIADKEIEDRSKTDENFIINTLQEIIQETELKGYTINKQFDDQTKDLFKTKVMQLIQEILL